MVVEVFSRSRKMATLPAARRRELGAAIHRLGSREELVELALRALGTSFAFGDAERNSVAGDIIDGRFDLLLRPDRFDCEDGARAALQVAFGPTAPPEEPDECPVCLGERAVDTRLPCGHELCGACA